MKYLGKHVFVPFISEETDSPIGVFEIDLTERYFSTMADIAEPFGNDIEEGGQCQENITDNQQNTNVKRFYDEWNYKHLEPFSSFTVEKMNELESDIDQLVSILIIGWCEQFKNTNRTITTSSNCMFIHFFVTEFSIFITCQSSGGKHLLNSLLLV